MKPSYSGAVQLLRLVGGPGFEPGASRSRTLRHLVQKSLKRSVSDRFLESSPGSRPDLKRPSVGLLHEVLHESKQVRSRAGRHHERSIVSGGSMMHGGASNSRVVLLPLGVRPTGWLTRSTVHDSERRLVAESAFLGCSFTGRIAMSNLG